MEKGFFASLFDFSFSEFITPRIISTLYIIGVVLAGIASIVMLFSMFRAGAVAGILALILVPLYFLLLVVFARVYMEIIVVFFKIYEGITALNQSQYYK